MFFAVAGLMIGLLEAWITVFHYPLIPFRGAVDRLGYLFFYLSLNGLAGALFGLLAAMLPVGLSQLRHGRPEHEPQRAALRSVRSALAWGMLYLATAGCLAYYKLIWGLGANPLEPKFLRYVGLWLGLLAVCWLVAHAAVRVVPWERVRPVHAAGTLVLCLLGLGLGFVLRGDGSQTVTAPLAQAGTAMTAGEGSLAGEGPVNLLFLTIDTLRADHVGAYGYQRRTSPWMDRYSRDALLFQLPVTQKTCTAPSFATMMTGLYPRTHGLSQNQSELADESNTLAERLGRQGYQTAAFVSNPACSQIFSFDQGFDFFHFTFYDEVEESSALNRDVASWLENQEEEPFFLWLHYNDPHSPYEVEEPFRSLFSNDLYGGRYRDRPVKIGRRARPGVIPRSQVIDDSVDLDHYVAQYDAEIRHNDFYLQQMMALLQRAGLLENTLVVLLSDHGESLVEHGYYMNHGHNAYNTQAVVPLIFRHPSLPRATVVPEIVQLVDLLPTLLSMLGVPYDPTEMEGRDLTPLIRGQGMPAGESVSFTEGKYEYKYSHIAVWDGKWKLIMVPVKLAYPLNRIVEAKTRFWFGGPVVNGYRTKVLRFELYDMEADPGETVNLAGSGLEAEAGERRHLMHWLDAHPVRLKRRVLSRQEIDERSSNLADQLEALGYVIH